MKRYLVLPHTYILIGLLFLLSASVLPQDIPDGDPERGGQIYDVWYNTLDMIPPEYDQPLWKTQEANLRTGTITWRCVSCHGWDYKGAEGAYDPDSPEYTGFPGVIDMVGVPSADIIAWLDGTRNEAHDFSEYLTWPAMNDLVAFLRTRLVDTDLMIAAESRSGLGDWRRGQGLYRQSCDRCHGIDGDKINFGDDAIPVFIGDIARRDPWRLQHKIRFGHPGSDMPSAADLGWTLQQVTDVITYAQILPEGQPYITPTPTELSVDEIIDRQGDTTGIVIGAILIVSIIAIGVGVSAIRVRIED